MTHKITLKFSDNSEYEVSRKDRKTAERAARSNIRRRNLSVRSFVKHPNNVWTQAGDQEPQGRDSTTAVHLDIQPSDAPSIEIRGRQVVCHPGARLLAVDSQRIVTFTHGAMGTMALDPDLHCLVYIIRAYGRFYTGTTLPDPVHPIKRA